MEKDIFQPYSGDVFKPNIGIEEMSNQIYAKMNEKYDHVTEIVETDAGYDFIDAIRYISFKVVFADGSENRINAFYHAQTENVEIEEAH